MVAVASTNASKPAVDWREQRVIVFNGRSDTHIETGEDYDTLTLGEVFALKPTDRGKMNAPSFIPSTYCSYDARAHAVQQQRGEFVALTGDIDKGDHDLADVLADLAEIIGDAAFFVFASSHARPGNRRWRIIVPLRTPCNFSTWHDAQTAFFDLLEEGGLQMDRALARAGQPVFLPNVPATHASSGEPLRGEFDEPLYFVSRARADAEGIDLANGPIADAMRSIVAKRRADDALRERIHREAVRKRQTRAADGDESLIDAFGNANVLADLLQGYGYQQSPRNADDWRSPNQTGDTFATRIVGHKWISLSQSDADAGLGTRHAAGCYGDAYDLLVHYEHGGDHRAAFRMLREERRVADPREYRAPSATAPQSNDNEPPKGGAGAGDEDPTPIDLWARYDAPTLPMGLLPKVIEQFAVRHGEVMGVEPVGLAMAALTVCAASIHDDIEVQVKQYDPTWRESARIWMGMIGPPSTKKSPIQKAAMKPLAKIDGVQMAAYMQAKAEYDALPAAERAMANKPIMKRHVVSDATVESLQEVLRGSTGGVISSQDELSGWFGAMDKYAPGRGAQADRSFWLQAFNGGRYTLDRIARGSSQIPNLSISLLGGIQPDVIRKIIGDSVDDGLVQRLIPVILPPARIGKDVPAGEVVQTYYRLVEMLVRMQPPPRAGIPSLEEATSKQPLKFSSGARSVRERLEEEHQQLVQSLEIVSPKLAAHFGKYEGIFARLCVTWHCIENAEQLYPPVEIGTDTAERVAEFMEKFLRPSAIAFYVGMLGLSDGHELLLGIASYIVAKELTEVDARTIQRSTRSLKSFTADDARRLCERLEGFGWVEQIDPKARSNTPRWRVIPAVHTMFAERGRQESERRKRAQEAIRNALS